MNINNNRYFENELVLKSLRRLFELLEKSRRKQFTVQVEQYFIYMEDMHDSSREWNYKTDKQPIRIKEYHQREFILENINRKIVCNFTELVDEFKKAHSNSKAYITNTSRFSAHVIYGCRVFVEQTDTNSKETVKSLFEIFDVPFKRDTLKITQDREFQIRKQSYMTSLLQVIHALRESNKFVPYRNSKITRLMTNCLGGKSYAAFVFDNYVDARSISCFKYIKNNPTKYEIA